MDSGFLLHAVVFLAAAVVCVPLARKLGMGSVLGYLIAGIAIGPYVLGFIGSEGQDIMHVAEFGVVMMLFIVGLELEPAKFWKMRSMIGGYGFSQMLITTAVFLSLGLLMQFTWQASLAISLALSMSSTAIVLQSLKEKGLLQTTPGQSSFAVLLFQDIAVIPILALLPLLAGQSAPAASAHKTLIDDLPAWLTTLAVLGAIGAVIAAGRFIIVPTLRIIATTRLRELFTASSLLIVVAIAYLMQQVGLSPALGAFLAGVVLANSEFKHELESDIEPFKGLLLGLFFIAVGASINFTLVANATGSIAAYVLTIICVKALILFFIGRFFKLSLADNALFSIGLSQVGEFAFVLFAFIAQLGFIAAEITDMMMVVIALSMTITPVLFLIHDTFIASRLAPAAADQQPDDPIEEKHAVIIAGFSHFGSTVGRFLRANNVPATILDNDPERVDLLRKMGFKVYYGDATRLDLLKSAGVEDARIFVSAIGDPAVNLQLLTTLRKHYPHLQIITRTENRTAAYQLLDLGITNIFRDTLHTSVQVGVEVLKHLGARTYSAHRAGQNFIRYDEAALQKLSTHRHDLRQYIRDVRAEIEQQEELLKVDAATVPNMNDHAWDSEQMRESIQRNTPR